jgi:hypothetical protein
MLLGPIDGEKRSIYISSVQKEAMPLIGLLLAPGMSIENTFVSQPTNYEDVKCCVFNSGYLNNVSGMNYLSVFSGGTVNELVQDWNLYNFTINGGGTCLNYRQDDIWSQRLYVCFDRIYYYIF